MVKFSLSHLTHKKVIEKYAHLQDKLRSNSKHKQWMFRSVRHFIDLKNLNKLSYPSPKRLRLAFTIRS